MSPITPPSAARAATTWLPTGLGVVGLGVAGALAMRPGSDGAAGGLTGVEIALTASWAVVTVTARLSRRPRFAWIAAVVCLLQAAALGASELGPLAVAGWVWALFAMPDGRVAGSARRVFVGATAAAALVCSALAAAAGQLSRPAFAALVGVGAVGVSARSILDSGRGRARGRASAQWALAGALIALASDGVLGASHLLLDLPVDLAPPALAGWVALPLAVAVGTHRRGAHLAPKALVESMVAAGLAVFVAAVYLVVVIGLGRSPTGAERGVLLLSLVAAFLSAALTVPVRARLADAAGRAVAGSEPSPQRLLSTFGTRMTRAVPMDELLLQLAELLRATLGPAGAEIWTGSGGTLARVVSVPDRPDARLRLGEAERTVVARARTGGNAWLSMWVPALLDDEPGVGGPGVGGSAAGAPGRGEVRVAPVTHLGELLGLLVVRRPPGAAPYTAEQDRVLVELARQVGLALHNVSLDTALQASLAELRERNAELTASRVRIVTAADASRRRLERDLHDGAQQHLVGLSVKLGLAGQIAAADPAAVGGLIEDLRTDVRAATAALRELAHGIYPPLLRDQGLASALRAAAGRSPLDCLVEVDAGRYPSDLEAAVYFCCLEAMQNAGKHAGAEATLTVTVTEDDGTLAFSVIDDGVGFDPSATAGHGFENMRDRVGAFGGTVEVRSAPGAGTSVLGTLPVKESQ